MHELLFTLALGILLSAITVFADFLVKHSSLAKGFSEWPTLLAGSIIYAATALGWFFITRKAKLSTLGVLYGVTCIVLLALISVFYFKEKISGMEIFGIALAIVSILIMARFA